MNKIHSTPFHPFEKQKVPDLVLKQFDMCALNFATDRFQAILVRAKISNEAEKGEQQRHNSPQLTLSFPSLCYASLPESSRCMRVYRILTRLASLTWNEKCKAWHSFSLTKATGTLVCCLFFFFATTYVTFWRILNIAVRNDLSSDFITILCKYPAKRDLKRLYGIFKVVEILNFVSLCQRNANYSKIFEADMTCTNFKSV